MALLMFTGKTVSQCQFFVGTSIEKLQLYTCLIQNFTSENSELLHNAEHLDGKSNADVKSIRIHNFEMETIPKTIGLLFTNLIEIDINTGNLNSLSSNDLQQFPKLKIFSVQNCPNLTELRDSHLFSHNPLLTHIYLKHGSLEAINYQIFDQLEKLELADFTGNRCTSELYFVAVGEFEKLRSDLGRNCLVPNTGYCGKLQAFDFCFLKDPKNKIDEVLQGFKIESSTKMTILEHKNSSFPSFSSKGFQLEKLIYVSIKGNIRSIDSSQLKWMPNVKELDLSNNQIKLLLSNTFDYTPNLETFKITNNRLQYIGVMTFVHLKQLTKVDFSGNRYCKNYRIPLIGGAMMTKSNNDKKL